MDQKLGVRGALAPGLQTKDREPGTWKKEHEKKKEVSRRRTPDGQNWISSKSDIGT